MKRRINLISLFLFFILNNNNQIVEATTSKTTNSTPPDIENLPLKNFQKVVSNCEAIREVFDHEGGAAGFTSNCVIKVWNDKDTPADLTSEQQEKLKSDLNGQQQQQPDQSNLDQIKLLQEEAANRHYMCMEAKRSILYQLKLQLPAGLNSCDKINQVLNDLKLSPLLEEFIKKVSGPMKEIVARIHVLEQNNEMPETEKLEALRKEKSELTRLLDEECKDDHPSIRFHNVGYLPTPEMQRLKMTLVVTHPDRKIEFFNLPTEGMGPQVDYLRSMTEAAAHHFQATGQSGPFKAHLMSAPRFEGGLDSAPGVISFVPAENGAAAGSNTSFNADNIEAVKKVLDPNQSNTPDSIKDSQINQPIESKSLLFEATTPIAIYWKSIIAAQELFANRIKSLAEDNNVNDPNGKANFEYQSKVQTDALNDSLREITLELIKSSNLADLDDPPNAQAIEKRYQASKALLKTARDYMPATDKKSILQYFSRSSGQSLQERMYTFSKDVIKKIRDDALMQLKNGKGKAGMIAGGGGGAAVIDNNPSNTSDSTDPLNSSAKVSTATPLGKKEELVQNFVTAVSSFNLQGDPQNTEKLKSEFKILFDENNLENIPDIRSIKLGYSLKSKERQQFIRNTEKMRDLLKTVVARLKAIKGFGKENVDLVNQIGNAVINQYNLKKEFQVKNIENGTAASLKGRSDDIEQFVTAVSDLKDSQEDQESIRNAFGPLFEESKVESMPEVPFSDPFYITRALDVRKLKRNEAKRKALLAEVLSRLEDKGYNYLPIVERIGNLLIDELAKPKKPAVVTAPVVVGNGTNDKAVGSFYDRFTSYLSSSSKPKTT